MSTGADGPPTAKDLSFRPQQYRKYAPEEFRAALQAGEDPDDLVAAMKTMESGRFEPLVEAVSDMFFKLDADEAELFTLRNPGIVRWMSVWNELKGRNPYAAWDDLAADQLTLAFDPPSRVGDPDRDYKMQVMHGSPPPYERREHPDRTLLEDMMWRRRSYREWTPQEFHDVALAGPYSLSEGQVRELRLHTAEIRADLVYPVRAEGKVVGRALFERIEAGRFKPMAVAANRGFVPLDPDERHLFAARNPGLVMWLSAWGFLDDRPHGENLFRSVSAITFPLIREQGEPGGLAAQREAIEAELGMAFEPATVTRRVSDVGEPGEDAGRFNVAERLVLGMPFETARRFDIRRLPGPSLLLSPGGEFAVAEQEGSIAFRLPESAIDYLGVTPSQDIVEVEILANGIKVRPEGA